ncbi:trimethylguanosine synthase-like [Daktulosphaira vitifoliae]|uniref:trimethylguanosine synthase-like n=1 Tax=Daktulosphaira vitifoliae TaxID=58002 RepID=UPI0021AA549D|nr:trimethylguanosine synthase-like [Daktulosphaira vitifoliae]
MDLTGNKVTASGDSDAPVPAVGGGRTHQVSTSIEYASNAGVLRQAPAANHGVGTATAGSGGDQATSAGSHPDKINIKQVRPNNVLKKYWDKRYSLFNKYDRGIQLDAESFYSVCPEILSYHIAQRCKGKVAMDPFCGAGGNIIQLARFYTKVIAIDKDPEKIKMAIHNSKIYGVEKHIIFIVGDFFKLANRFKADVIVTSPPWGGPNYSKKKNYTLRNMCQDQGHDGFDIFELARKIAPNIVLHLPKNIYLGECQSLANSFNDKLQIEKNFMNNKLDSISAFFGDFY